MTGVQTKPLISLREIEKRYGVKKCLDDLSLDIYANDFITLVGPNGAGKTSLLKIMCGLLSPSGGNVDVQSGFLDRRGIAYISHQSMLYSDLTGRENLEMFASLYGLPDKRERASAIIREIGLEDDADRFVRNYSRGMVQRLSLGRFLINDPSLLLLDEPFTGLDSRGSYLLCEILAAAYRDGKTVVLVTHNLQRGFELGKRLVGIRQGRIFLDMAASGLSFEEFLLHYERGLGGG